VRDLERSYLRDGDAVELDGIRICGVGGIIGNKRKPGRRPENTQRALLDRALDRGADVLVVHEGPHGSDHQPGHPLLRDVVEAAGVGLAICGHVHWHDPLAGHPGGQILNVDTRVVVLRT
jgi:3',5'-cyclic-AMP phosphodiesterase